MANCCELFPAPKAAAHTELLWLPRGQRRRRLAAPPRGHGRARAGERVGREEGKGTASLSLSLYLVVLV